MVCSTVLTPSLPSYRGAHLQGVSKRAQQPSATSVGREREVRDSHLTIELTHSRRLELKDSRVQKWTEMGIAVHHAGLEILDRRNIEQGFRESKLHLLVATSVRLLREVVL